MRKLVVYYSLEGHVKELAEALSEETGADIIRVQPKDDVPVTGFFRYLKGGGQVVRKKEPEIYPLSLDPAEYDLLFIGSPVWAGGYAPALRTLFAQINLKGKKAALFVSHRGGKGTALQQLADSLEGNEIVGQVDFVEKNQDSNVTEIRQWGKDIASRLEG